jgi:cell division protease FtsH
MNGESKPTLRPLLFVILFGVLVTSVVTAFRSGFVQVAVRWPEDQPSAPLLVALLGVALALLTVYLIVSGRRASGRPSEPPLATGAGPRTPTRPSRIGLVAERPPTRFTDVAGAEEAKEELSEIVEFLREPERFLAVGARIPRGVLLVGPPGNGKTLLARAVAGEAGVPFLRASGSDFVEMYVGVGASRVRDLFKAAREHGRSIIFIDEIDAVGRKRGGPSGHAHEEREQTLNQLLVEMDGFDLRSRVIVVAATNRPDVLDPALLRPGRFDRQVRLESPDAAARRHILTLHARGKPFAEGVDLEAVIPQTTGLSGADLENLLNEAAILCARDGRTRIEMHDLEEALDRVTAGPRRKGRSLSEVERKITAVHELGHALVAHLLPDADPVQKVTIVSRGQMGGYTRMTPEEDRKMWSVPQFKAAMASAMGGHVAEELAFGQVTTGASNDLKKAYNIARAMVCDYGMSPVLGGLAVGSDDDGGRFYRGYGEHLAEKIDAEQHRLVDEARGLAIALLQPRLDQIKKASEELLDVETIDGKAMARIFGPRPTTAPQLPPVRLVPEVAAATPTVEPIPAARPARRSTWGGGLKPALAMLPFTLSVHWRRRRKQAPGTLAEA